MNYPRKFLTCYKSNIILKKTGTLPATDSSHRKMDGWSTIVSFRDGLFSVTKRPAFLGRFPNLARDLHVAGHHFRSLGWSWFQERLICINVIFYAYSAGTYWNHGLICRFSCCSMFDTVKFGDSSTLYWNHVAHELSTGRWQMTLFFSGLIDWDVYCIASLFVWSHQLSLFFCHPFSWPSPLPYLIISITIPMTILIGSIIS